MAFFDTRTTKFWMANSTATLQDISAYCTEITGLPGKRDLVDVTTFGSIGHQWGPSLQNAEFTIRAFYSQDATTGLDTIFGPMLTATSTRAFQLSYSGSSTSTIYTGNSWCADYGGRAQVGRYVEMDINCKVDNGVTRTTS